MSRRFWLIVYLAIWSTAAARLSFEFVYLLIPKRGDFAGAAQLVPFIAAALGSYLWLAPVLLYGLLLFAVAAMAGAASPAGAFFVLTFGAVFGLPALVIEILIHAIGLFPLCYFEDRFLAGSGPSRKA